MPVYEPGKTLEIILESDRGKPDPPVWQVKALSCREAIELGKRIDAELAKKTEPQQIEALAAILDEYVEGWSGLSQPYAPGTLLDVTGPRDLWRLDAAIRYQLGLHEKKD